MTIPLNVSIQSEGVLLTEKAQDGFFFLTILYDVP